jgi:3-oxoacyl-ACP reductase-like protein
LNSFCNRLDGKNRLDSNETGETQFRTRRPQRSHNKSNSGVQNALTSKSKGIYFHDENVRLIMNSSFLIQGKIAIVTGAGSGIGTGIAEVLAENGAKVVAVDLDESRAKTTAEKIR